MRTLKHRIMFLVYAFWAWRFLKRPLTVELGALALLFATLAFSISIPSIISNTLDSQSAYRYLFIAFSHTDHLAKLLLLVTGLTMLYVARNLAPQKVLKFRFVRFA